MPIGVLAVGAVVSVAAFAAANRSPLPRPAGAWGVPIDIAVIVLLVLGVTGLGVVPTGTSFDAIIDSQLIQFHQDFFLGPANQVVTATRCSSTRSRSTASASIYSIAGWFELVPIGNGTLGLLDGVLSARIVLPAPTLTLRLGRSACALACVGHWRSRCVALVYGLDYPGRGAAAARSDSLRLPRWWSSSPRRSRRGWTGRVPARLHSSTSGSASIWALEAFAYTL